MRLRVSRLRNSGVG